ncbi:MAG: quinolinate synthase NadA [Alphaproteobacteria bacterium]|nr:quinolinate synthase NadA [Alphaproteobacteria bacterium]
MGILPPQTAAALQRTAALYDRVKSVIPEMEWAGFAEDVDAILRLKAERNAVILAHNYMRPEIFHAVADVRGDSLALAREAAKIDADVIVVAGVHFMAETAKLLNPGRTVLIPDTEAGCSLAESITAADVRALRARHPGVPVVTYVNTSAAVKAESDICCTSGNAKKIVESLGVPEVIMLPDEYLAQNVQRELNAAVAVATPPKGGAEPSRPIKLITWQGHCEVHERFSPADIALFREQNPGVIVLAHPECPPDVVASADYAGSTAGMIDWVGAHKPARALLLTECSMSDNVAVEQPETEFVRPCQLCPHMKRISLANIRAALENMEHEVVIPADVAAPARRAVERMIAVR